MDKNKTFYREIGSEKYQEEIRLLQNRILELQNESDDLTNKLTKAVHTNGVYLDAMEEMINNNNPAPAEEILNELNPKFSDNHIAPNQFMDLSVINQQTLMNSIPLKGGDVLYSLKHKQFNVVCGIEDETVILHCPGYIGKVYIKYDNVEENFIPCYAPHQLWDFLEDYLGEKIEINYIAGDYVKVCNPISCKSLGIGDTKVKALLSAVVNVLE